MDYSSRGNSRNRSRFSHEYNYYQAGYHDGYSSKKYSRRYPYRDRSRVNDSNFRDRSPVQDRNGWGDARRQIHCREKTRRSRTNHGRVEDRTATKTKSINHLEYLATKSGPEIVTIISDDQKVFFGSLNNNDVLKNNSKLKTLIQIIYNIINASIESEHLNTLLSQITLEKYEKFYSHLREFIKKLPSRQSVDENVIILKQVTHIFRKLIVSIPKQCEMLPLDELQEVTKMLQQQEQGFKYDEYVACAKSLVELFKESEAMEVDGDLYDYQTIPVLPEAHEINRQAKPKLQANIIDGSYKDWDHYLHVQFSLLREDYISPLRQGICDYNRGMKEKSKENISVYNCVRILEPIFLHSGVGFRIQFDVAESHLRYVQWEHSTRLIYGSLLCLSRSEFASVLFATVIDRDPESLRDGILKVQFENNEILQILQINPWHEFTMVESTAYFEAYRHVLNRLKNIAEDPPSYNAYILHYNPKLCIPLPFYLQNQGGENNILLDLTGLEGKNSTSKSNSLISVNILDSNAWPHYNDVGLDKSQLAAIQMALTQELSLIQGPPGTGKIHTGIRIVDILLKNKALIQNSPILVVCYTNHALDQFLEGILKFTGDGDNPIRMVRIGGRCSSKDIEPYTLTEHKRADKYPCLRKNVRDAMQLMDECHKLIKRSAPNFNLHVQENPKILELNDLSTVINYNHAKQLKNSFPACEKNNEIKYWLFSAKHKRELERKSYDKTHVPNPKEATVADVDAEARLLEDNRITGELIELKPCEDKEEQTAMDMDCNDSKDDSHQSYEKAQIKKGLKHKPMTEVEVHDVKSITTLSYQQRWSLYQNWTSRYMQKRKQRVAYYVEAYSHACEKYHEAQNILNCAVLGDAHIVGMTTTGAAKYHNILQKIKPRIIVIEEAAEVLESHIVTALTSSTQQVIMIGDHQQLRPKPSDYHLATKYNLEVSLFERLVKNKLPFVTLEVQHRMRPEIAELICPHIYETLRNAPKVCDYRDVMGVKHNVYFISHTNPEDDCSDDSMGHSNKFEAEFCIKLCSYFLKCGYHRSQITILTTYSRQLLKMKNTMPKAMFEGVRVTSVDNFQGEENNIIILSLVRSNNRSVGFLKESNRVSVALSRAKMGLFVIGNFSLMMEAGGKLWKSIIGDMEKKGLVGKGLPLFCSIHNITTLISSIDDFLKVPEGGCMELCGIELPCGHVCPRVCHQIMDHSTYKCKEKCHKVLPCGHTGAMECCVELDMYECYELVERTLTFGHIILTECCVELDLIRCHEPCTKILSCGHKCKEECHMECTRECQEPVTKMLLCGHFAQNECCCRPTSKITCQEICPKILSCGHPCSGDCHSCHMGRLHMPCKFFCGRLQPCGHICKFPCIDIYECPPCNKPCSCRDRCNHGKCTNECCEPCDPCKKHCPWRCKHYKCTKKCGEMCDRPRCNHPCTKILPRCLHPCIGLCKEKCPVWCRICDAKQVTKSFFGTESDPDARFIQLEDCGHILEVTGLDQWMDQQDDTKAVEIKFKCCPKCKTSIRRSLRYGNIIKQTLHDMQKVACKKQNLANVIVTDHIREELVLVKHSVHDKEWYNCIQEFIDTIEEKIYDCACSQLGSAPHEIDTIYFQIKNLPQIFRLLDFTYKVYKMFEFPKVKIYTTTIENQVLYLCDFVTKVQYLTKQIKTDIEFEFNHLFSLIQLCQLCDIISITCVISEEDNKLVSDIALHLFNAGISSSSKITNDHASDIFCKSKSIEYKYEKLGHITKEEKLLNVKTIGLRKGHWHKCTNDHYFCATEHGSDLQIVECPECIGDTAETQSTLTSVNQHASEMED